MNLFDDCGSSSDASFRRYGIAGCLGDVSDEDPGVVLPTESSGDGLPPTVNVREGSGYTVERGVVTLAPDEVDATAGTNPSGSGGYGPGAQGTMGPFHAEPTWKAPTYDEPGLPTFAAPSSGGGAILAVGAAALFGVALLGGKKRRR